MEIGYNITSITSSTPKTSTPRTATATATTALCNGAGAKDKTTTTTTTTINNSTDFGISDNAGLCITDTVTI